MKRTLNSIRWLPASMTHAFMLPGFNEDDSEDLQNPDENPDTE